MAKKTETKVETAPVTNLPATTQETKALAPTAKTASFPAMVGASPELLERVNEVKDNLESVENFRLPRIKMTSDGAETMEGEAPVEVLTATILHTKKTNVYYDKPYNPSAVELPTCFSLDGNMPDKSIEKPVNLTCKGCPMAEFGTNSMKSGKACRNLKPMFLLLSDEAIMPRQLTVTPTGLKAANQYLMDLTERGFNYRKVKTEISFYKENPRDTYCKVKFKMAGKLEEGRAKDVEFLRGTWLNIMNNSNIDQNEVEQPAQAAPAAVDTGGEY